MHTDLLFDDEVTKQACVAQRATTSVAVFLFFKIKNRFFVFLLSKKQTAFF